MPLWSRLDLFKESDYNNSVSNRCPVAWILIAEFADILLHSFHVGITAHARRLWPSDWMVDIVEDFCIFIFFLFPKSPLHKISEMPSNELYIGNPKLKCHSSLACCRSLQVILKCRHHIPRCYLRNGRWYLLILSLYPHVCLKELPTFPMDPDVSKKVMQDS